MNNHAVSKRSLNRAGFAPLIGIATMFLPALGWAQSSPTPAITLVANAEGGSATIAPNTWVEIKGSNLAPAGDSRIWQGSDFVNSQMPTQLDGVGVTMNGENAYVYYISPTQVNVLTPSDLVAGPVQVKVTSGGVASASFTAEAQAYSPSFFIFGAGPYVVGIHANGTLLGPTSLYPGLSTPAAPGELVVLYANGFGPVSPSVVPGSEAQSGDLPSTPVIDIGGLPASVQFAGLVTPGLYQFNVVVPVSVPNGDNMLTALYSGLSVQSGVLLTVQNPNSAPQLESISLSASQATSGSSVQGTVFLSIPAGSAGVTVALSSNSAAASVPSSVTIPTGATSASFTVSAGTVSATQAATITATYNGNSSQAALTVNPPPVTSALCYQFSSGNAASLTINITNLPTPIVSSIGGIYTSYQYPAFGAPGISESLTIGQTTYVGPTAPTAIYILTDSASSTSTLEISGGVLVGPGLGNDGAAGIVLSGNGNLLPNGLTAALPPISAWGMTANMNVTAGSSITSTTYPLTSITSCEGSSN